MREHAKTTPTDPQPAPELPLTDFLNDVALVGPIMFAVAVLLTGGLHLANLRGTFAIFPALAGLIVVAAGQPVEGCTVAAGCLFGGVCRERIRWDEIKKGGDKARKQRDSNGVITTLRNIRERRLVARGVSIVDGSYPAGVDQRGRVAWLPLGLGAGRHALLIGATGSGKTTTMSGAIQANLVAGAAVIVIDPKGDPGLVNRLRQEAFDAGRPFWRFSLDGASDRWNPLTHGSPTERTDKLIGAEEWTEPHYKRLYQRYLLAVFTAVQAKGDDPDLGRVVNLLNPERFALYVRDIRHADVADRLGGYLADLTSEERRDLAGLRNRLAILTEGEHRDLLSGEGDPTNQIDLLLAIRQGAVVVFSLNSSSAPETARLLGAAIFQDLKHVAGILEANPTLRHPAALIVDEFGAFGADHVLGLFQRARSAGLSLALSTQELSDLRNVSPAFQDQILGNVETIVAHRQAAPESAELVAQLGGTREVWIHTFQTRDDFHDSPRGHGRLGTKRRGHEFHISPDTIKALQTGEAIVITKNPHTVRRVRIYPAPPLNYFHPPQPAREVQARALAYAQARPDRVHHWLHRN